MTKEMWDEQFGNSKWAYLADETQREHYDKIIDLYLQHAAGRTILDIGCGEGLLYRYFSDRIELGPDQYTGIDISEVAVAHAKNAYPNGHFEVMNYETDEVPHRHDVIIFNETLYYFNHAGRTLEKCVNRNLGPGGFIIISMCDHERHDLIWKMINRTYKVQAEAKSSNTEGISWTIKVIVP